MSEFLVEAYVSRAAASAAAAGVEAASIAAEQLSQEGSAVRLVHAVFVPEDEICFYLYRAESAEAVREAAIRAGLRFERITKAHSSWRRMTRRSGSQSTSRRLMQ